MKTKWLYNYYENGNKHSVYEYRKREYIVSHSLFTPLWQQHKWEKERIDAIIKRNSDISTKKAQGYYKDIETADKALKAFFDEVGW